MQNLSEGNQFLGQILESPEYEVGVVAITLQHSI
jgi:hypothetical protein